MRLAVRSRMPFALGGSLLVLLLFTALSPAARADVKHFCPNTDSSLYIPGNSRCASGQLNQLRRVEGYRTSGQGDFCVAGKQSSGGYGADVIGTRCTSGDRAITPCVSPRVGFATIINQSVNGKLFKGYADVYGYIGCS